MKIKISLHDAAKYAAAGLKVEHYLVVNGEEITEPSPTKTRYSVPRNRTLITNDNTLYALTAKVPPTKGSARSKIYHTIKEALKGDLQKYLTRKELVELVRAKFPDLDDEKILSQIAGMRHNKHLRVVDL